MGNLKVFVLLAGNALATGRNGQNAAVCATEGLMKRVDRDELEGVMPTSRVTSGHWRSGPRSGEPVRGTGSCRAAARREPRRGPTPRLPPG
jgi:hypothetical protein